MVGEINWGLMDPSAAAKAAGSFQQGQVNRLAMEQGQQEQAMNALALRQRQQGMADIEAERTAYAQSGGDASKLGSALRGAGLHKQAMDIEGQQAAQQAAAKKAQIEDALKHIQVVGQVAGGVTDQATYDAAKQQLASIYGPESVANMPPQFDPTMVKQFTMQSLSAKDQLEQQRKALDAQLEQQKFGFEKQKFGAQQGLERQKMAQSAAQFAQSQGLEREKLGAKEGEGKPLTEAQAKATTFASQMNEASNAMDELEKGGLNLSKTSTQGLIGMAGGAANPLVPADAQQYKQAQNQWSESFLRVKTGAAATQGEIDLNNRTFFPQLGDDSKTVERKRKAREAAERDVLNMAAGGKEKVTQRKSPSATLPGGWSVEEH